MIVKIIEVPKVLPKYKLPSNILKHCNLYKEAKAKQMSLFAWITLSKYINLNKVTFTKKGKPISKDKSIYFSLSHSDGVVAFAINNKPIGVDIQSFVPLKKANLLAKRMLNESDFNKYLQSKNKSQWFTKYWTQYESLIKMNGKFMPLKGLFTLIKIIKINKINYCVNITTKK